MNLRRGVLGLGVATVVVGSVLFVQPALATNVGVPRAFLLVIGVFAAAQAALDIHHRRGVQVEGAEVRDPEVAWRGERVGADLDGSLAVATDSANRFSRERRNAIRERVERVAVRVLVNRHGCDPEEAEAMLAEGTWTDDPYAAAFFGAHEVEEDRGLRSMLAHLFRGDPAFRRNATHAIDELTRLASHDT